MTQPDIPRDRDTPASVDPRRGENPGYAEVHPRDKADARDPRTGKVPNPEAGGLNRPQVDDGDPATE